MPEALSSEVGQSSADRDAEFKCNLVTMVPHLRAFARGLCGRPDQADDLVQDAMMRAWDARASFSAGSNMRAWAFTILRNQFLNEIRRNRRLVQLGDQDEGGGGLADRQHRDAMALSDLHEALNHLPAERREAILLVGASGFSIEEAARICGVAPGTIKSRVARGRAQLAALLGAADDSAECPAEEFA